MASKDITTTKLDVPSGVTLNVSGQTVSVSGPKGKSERTFNLQGVSYKKDGNTLEVTGPLREANTASAHLRNMLAGAATGFSHKMKVIYAHFPISIEVKGGEVLIKNFIGEKQPRRARVVGATKVEAKGADVTVSGPSREDVSQTMANLRSATKIKNRDSRIFQDGIYPVEG